MTVTERLLHYVSFDTQSDESSETCPSTAKQKLLGEALVEEMRAMGIADARIDKDGYVYGSVPGTPGAPAIGLIAHMDTSPDCSGRDIKPRIVEYTGGDIALNDTTALSSEDFPILNRSIGKHLIVTDGTTLLGADDKAGIAEILTAVEELLAEGGAHASLRIGFTPDEEIGRGADRFDLAHFGAVHPGSAKRCMVNAQLIAMEFHGMLPVHDRPEATEGYEGFSHLCAMQGEVELATLEYIIRDHDRASFEARKALFESAAAFLNAKYGAGTVEVALRDSYYNMREKIEPHMAIVEAAQQAMRDAGVTPRVVPIRGGTDGARLSYEGLPCPNLFTGGENYHGRFEYVPVEDMEAAVRTLKCILRNAAK